MKPFMKLYMPLLDLKLDGPGRDWAFSATESKGWAPVGLDCYPASRALGRSSSSWSLSRTVELKDWGFAMLQAALKYYAKNHPHRRGYVRTLQEKLRGPFADLVKETKRENHCIRGSTGCIPLSEFQSSSSTRVGTLINPKGTKEQ